MTVLVAMQESAHCSLDSHLVDDEYKKVLFLFQNGTLSIIYD